MNRDIDGRLAEIQETFIDLGGDLLALRTVAKAAETTSPVWRRNRSSAPPPWAPPSGSPHRSGCG